MLRKIKKGVRYVMEKVKEITPNETNEYIKKDMYIQLSNSWGAEKIVEIILLAAAGACAFGLCGAKFIPNKGV